MGITNYVGMPINLSLFLQIFKVVNFAKKTRILKNSIKFIIHFFQKEIIWHTYICTKWIYNFKFSISLKSYEE